MAAGAHLIELGQSRDLAQMRDPARMDDRGPDIIDELVLNEVLAVVDAVEDLADRERRHRMLSDEAESVLILGRGRILHPEQAVRFQRLPEASRFDRREPVMDVVQDMVLEAESLAQAFKELGREI